MTTINPDSSIAQKDSKRKEAIKKHLKLLKILYHKLFKGIPQKINYSEKVELSAKAGLSEWSMRPLTKIGILSVNNKFEYSWIDLKIKPSEKLAEKLYDAVRLMHINKTAEDNKTPAKDTEKIKNILSCLNDFYNLMKDAPSGILTKDLRISEQAKKYKIDAFNLRIVLVDSKIFKQVGLPVNDGHGGVSAYSWTREKPSIEMATNVLKDIRAIYVQKNKEHTLNKKNAKNTEKREYNKKTTPKNDSSKKHLWKDIAHRAIDMDDPELALKALNKM